MSDNIKELQFEKCLVRLHIQDITEEDKKNQGEKQISATRKFLYEIEKRRKKVSSCD